MSLVASELRTLGAAAGPLSRSGGRGLTSQAYRASVQDVRWYQAVEGTYTLSTYTDSRSSSKMRCPGNLITGQVSSRRAAAQKPNLPVCSPLSMLLKTSLKLVLVRLLFRRRFP